MIFVRLIGVRLLLALATLLLLSGFIFWAAEVVPGDIALRVLGRESTPEQRRLFREQLGVDRPVPVRYGEWVIGVVHGDFGRSYLSKRDVAEIIAPRLQNTFYLGAYAFILSIPVTFVLASISAVFQGRATDAAISLSTLIGLSIPEFVLGTILLILFGVLIPVFPVMSLIQQARDFSEFLRMATLPAIVLCVNLSVYAIRMLRDNLIDVLGSEYVRMAVLNGLPRWRVVLRHALPNALGPALNVMAINLTVLVGGVVVVETVFAYPGTGGLLINSLADRDMPVVEAVALLGSATYVLGNLLADLGSLALNPRLRTG